MYLYSAVTYELYFFKPITGQINYTFLLLSIFLCCSFEVFITLHFQLFTGVVRGDVSEGCLFSYQK